MNDLMERLSNFCTHHKWAYVVGLPVLLPYAFYKLFGALAKWGKS